MEITFVGHSKNGGKEKWCLMFTKTAYVDWKVMHSNGSAHLVNGADWHASLQQAGIETFQMPTLVHGDTCVIIKTAH
jgi:hypothetical protein